MTTTFLLRASSAVTAKADEASARAYLKSLGVTVGDLSGNYTGTISFELPTKKLADAAVVRLTKVLGRPKTGDSAAFPKFTWKMPGKNRSIVVETCRDFPEEGLLALLDTEDYVVQRKNQLKDDAQKLKPLKDLDRKFKPGEIQLFAAIFTVTNLGIGSVKLKGDKLVMDIGHDRSYPLSGNLESTANGILYSLMNFVAGDMAEDDVNAEYKGWLKDLKNDTLYSLAKVHSDMADLCLYLANH